MNNNSTPFKKRANPFADVATTTATSQVETTVAHHKVVDESNREKYTATMDKALRKRVKIASAMDGIQVSSFIEQACLEKLEREGK